MHMYTYQLALPTRIVCHSCLTFAAPSCCVVRLFARTGLSNAILPMSCLLLGGLAGPNAFSSFLPSRERLHASIKEGQKPLS